MNAFWNFQEQESRLSIATTNKLEGVKVQQNMIKADLKKADSKNPTVEGNKQLHS
jgi:hypothetical protein